jgi:hypothetical protein
MIGSYLPSSPIARFFWLVGDIAEEKGEFLRDRLIQEHDSRVRGGLSKSPWKWRDLRVPGEIRFGCFAL